MPKAKPLADWEALSLPEIEQKPKTVIRDTNFVAARPLTTAQEQDFVRLVGLIRNGGELVGFYRKSARFAEALGASRAS